MDDCAYRVERQPEAKTGMQDSQGEKLRDHGTRLSEFQGKIISNLKISVHGQP